MKIVKVSNKKELKSFVNFPSNLYKKDKYFIKQKNNLIFKQLEQDVLKENKYNCLLCVKNNVVIGTVLYYFSSNNKKEKVCLFSHLEFIKNKRVFKAFYDYITFDMQQNNINIIRGPFFNRHIYEPRGLLIQGFDYSPMLYCGYNKPYYSKILEFFGFNKNEDFFTMTIDEKKQNEKILKDTTDIIDRRYNLKIYNFNEIKQPLKIVESILSDSYFDKNDIELNANIEYFKKIINYKMALIVKDVSNRENIGFIFAIQDKNENNKNVKKAKIVTMCILPKYEQTDLGTYLYLKLLNILKDLGFNKIEIGTLQENNFNLVKMARKVGGEIIHIYRLFDKNIKE